ncbi:glycine--tRNA ligase alpha subunit [Striga asiatica]|uniref:glycine--tRNA ligase n=1 Tax=Striga asiatica TaxID=4170 RepID=A0A5A7RI65_STRAF|nr:glycine--tRNA ligase alpha subunit [Striga asiatica]
MITKGVGKMRIENETLAATHSEEYDQLLKTSHAFNVLDSRGFVGVTERARYFGRMRSLARQCAQLWLKTRESLGHPLGVASHPDHLGFQKEDMVELKKKVSTEPRTFILEIGTEELPPNDVVNACNQVLKFLS